MKKNTLPKPKQLVRFDWAIKRLLRSKANFGVLEGFLSELLKCKLKAVDISESEATKSIKKINTIELTP